MAGPSNLFEKKVQQPLKRAFGISSETELPGVHNDLHEDGDWGGHGGYMAYKKRKLLAQFEEQGVCFVICIEHSFLRLID